ncbi:hypothetical protein B0H14DRAFT_2629083 [Mycena olivaceomarginata]|nr:hypothetical protein B0H14DRAFT_2629083 [Mycena olivaceomarginata]
MHCTQSRVLKLPGAESHAADPAWEHLNEGTEVPVSLPWVKSGGNNSEDLDERNADGISENNYQRFELLILVAATISHHSQSSHRNPVAVEFSGETTPQQIANLRGEISQLRGQLESLQVTVETLSKNMVTTFKFYVPYCPSLNETKPPKTDSDSEDDAVPQPEPVVKVRPFLSSSIAVMPDWSQKGKQPSRGVAKPIPIKGKKVPKEVLTKTDSDFDDDVVPPPEPVAKPRTKPRSGAAKGVLPQRRNVLKEVPKTDSDSDEEVVPPPEPVLKPRTKPRSGAAKGILPQRRNVLKEVPRTDSDSDEEVVPPPEPVLKPRTKPRSGAAKGVLPQRRNVLKEVPKTDSDSDEEVVPPPEPVVKPRTKPRSGAAKGVPPKRRNIMKEAPSLRATTHSDSDPPGPTVKVPTFVLDCDLFLTGHRNQSLAELSPRPSEKLAVAPRRIRAMYNQPNSNNCNVNTTCECEVSVFVGAKKSANMGEHSKLERWVDYLWIICFLDCPRASGWARVPRGGGGGDAMRGLGIVKNGGGRGLEIGRTFGRGRGNTLEEEDCEGGRGAGNFSQERFLFESKLSE